MSAQRKKLAHNRDEPIAAGRDPRRSIRAPDRGVSRRGRAIRTLCLAAAAIALVGLGYVIRDAIAWGSQNRPARGMPGAQFTRRPQAGSAGASAQSAPASQVSLPDDAREALIRAALGPTARQRRSTHFSLFYDPAVEELVEIALQTAEGAHEDVLDCLHGLGFRCEPCQDEHVILITRSRGAFVRSLAPERRKGVHGTTGAYDDTRWLLFWLDQRNGPQQLAALQDLSNDWEGTDGYRNELEKARAGGPLPRLGLGGHQVPRRTIEECDSYIRMREAEAAQRQRWLCTPEAGVQPELLRHEVAHQVLFEHRAMAQPVGGWLCEGMACAFEQVKRDGQAVRPARMARRIGQLRLFLLRQRGLELAPEPAYSPEVLARTSDLREMINNNFVTQQGQAQGVQYYARYWAFVYWLFERRPKDLGASLVQTLEYTGSREASARSWVRNFEAVFGDNYDALAREYAEFLVQMLREDDEESRRMELEWRRGEQP